jgi:xanthine dehydrogenase molybdopterin-binding subunit B
VRHLVAQAVRDALGVHQQRVLARQRVQRGAGLLVGATCMPSAASAAASVGADLAGTDEQRAARQVQQQVARKTGL